MDRLLVNTEPVVTEEVSRQLGAMFDHRDVVLVVGGDDDWVAKKAMILARTGGPLTGLDVEIAKGVHAASQSFALAGEMFGCEIARLERQFIVFVEDVFRTRLPPLVNRIAEHMVRSHIMPPLVQAIEDERAARTHPRLGHQIGPGRRSHFSRRSMKARGQ